MLKCGLQQPVGILKRKNYAGRAYFQDCACISLAAVGHVMLQRSVIVESAKLSNIVLCQYLAPFLLWPEWLPVCCTIAKAFAFSEIVMAFAATYPPPCTLIKNFLPAATYQFLSEENWALTFPFWTLYPNCCSSDVLSKISMYLCATSINSNMNSSKTIPILVCAGLPAFVMVS